MVLLAVDTCQIGRYVYKRLRFYLLDHVPEQPYKQIITKIQTDYWYYCSNLKRYYPHIKRYQDDWALSLQQICSRSPMFKEQTK